MKLKNLAYLLFATVFGMSQVFAGDSASVDFGVTIDSFLLIEPVTAPVLTANITDRTGNLASPLQTKFRVISNVREKKTLYLQAKTNTDAGLENAMFNLGGQVYLAFSNITKIPKSQSLANCKNGAGPLESAGVVAYPITSIQGTQTQYIPKKQKYEVYVDNGTTYVTVNIGANVLKNSFGSNDPGGFYKTTLMLTEADI